MTGAPQGDPIFERNQAISRAWHGQCPRCGVGELVAGPWGGHSRNVFCTDCMLRWTFHGMNYGIIRVTCEGEASQADIAWAKERYPNDQPFAPPVRRANGPMNR